MCRYLCGVLRVLRSHTWVGKPGQKAILFLLVEHRPGWLPPWPHRLTFPAAAVNADSSSHIRIALLPFVFFVLFCFLFYFETGSLSIGLDSLELVTQTRVALSSQRFTCLCLPKAGIKSLETWQLVLFILLTTATLIWAKWNPKPFQFIFPPGLNILNTFKNTCWAFLFLL